MRKRLGGMAGLLACAAASCGGAALAQNVLSGGAWLPMPLYQEAIASSPATGLQSYVATGSSAGLRAFLTNDSAAFERTGPVHWVGSDSALTQRQIDDYLTLGPGRYGDPAGHGPLIQMPAAYVSVAVSYKGPAEPVTLTPGQLCRVFSGGIDRWSQLGVAVAPGLDAFKVVYRADGSGATELLTRHLAGVCGADSPVALGGRAVFKDAFKPGLLPPHFVAAQGEAGVALVMAGNVSAITYTGPDAAFTAGLKPAWLVNAQDGVAYLPTPANVAAAMQSHDGAGLPGGPALRHPSDSGWSSADNPGNPANWVRIVSQPRHGYPIVGTTNVVLSQCYADPAVAAAIRLFFKRFYEDTLRVSNHQMVPLPAPVRARLLATFVTPVGDSSRLNIGNPVICGDLAGRG
ncbi:substrate-binding domain-containing protein [Achromobacter sp. UMC71]|uniref:substrate-binding domain-containing protein n=1 Tax=Achromobacter sp. UMC71 TaxID=1862320 RepID=UPI001603171D|nr:substrate-binding domain-containing protein [Achromobacter sp. UMC71]MBB1627368.1 hypothetical protein [Achromobacter sp. UMC71]